MGITRHNKPQRKHPAPRASDDLCYGITEVYSQSHTRRRQKNTLRSIVTPIVCPRTWAENGDVAVTATAVRMIYYSRHTHEEEAKKHTAVDCDTDRVPANWAENGDVAVTTTAVCTSTTTHRRRS